MARRDLFFRFPAMRPILLHGITEPSLVMVTPEKPALQPERVRLHPEGGEAAQRILKERTSLLESLSPWEEERIFWRNLHFLTIHL
jgi:hypothetical protein